MKIAIFAEGAVSASAQGHFVHVYVDRATVKADCSAGVAHGLAEDRDVTRVSDPSVRVPADRAPAGDYKVVDHAITTRQSVRAFVPTPIPRDTIEDILRVASRAPSGTNTQPWRATVVTGAAKPASHATRFSPSTTTR